MQQMEKKWDIPIATFLIGVHILALGGIYFFSLEALLLAAFLYVFTAFGITFGFHRYFTHKSFKAHRAVEVLAALAGTLALQGGLKKWVADHRRHHLGSDTKDDPHNANEGFFHCHMGWLLKTDPKNENAAVINRLSRDIDSDPILSFLSKTSVGLGLQVGLALLCYLFAGWPGVFWGIFVRLVFVYHVTWFVNSAAHTFGYKNYHVSDHDRATNCWWVGLLALGEGWHNNHHKYGELARHGHRWFEFDATYLLIILLEKLGLVSKVKDMGPTQLKLLEVRKITHEPAVAFD